jgi:hypothetical protein
VIDEPATTGQSPPLLQVGAAVIDEPATTGQSPPLLQVGAAVIDEPATTGQPPPLLQIGAAVIEESATTGQPPPLLPRRRLPAPDHSGKPCGCGCGKALEYKAYKNCYHCKDKDPSIAYKQTRLFCYGSGKHCIECGAE